MNEQVRQFQTPDGSFSQTGMWKLKSKLLPRQTDPPMAKADTEGNLITGTGALKQLYSKTYVDRLSHRQIKPEFKEIYELKTSLWAERLRSIKLKKSCSWTLTDIEKVTKRLKNNQSRDPNGMVNELLKPNIMGQDLKLATLQLMNGIKKNMFFPDFMELANISSIYKNKGSKFDLENNRGMFILPVLRVFMNTGIQKWMRKCPINIFMIYGIINNVLNEYGYRHSNL